jgi:hypothetical protein
MMIDRALFLELGGFDEDFFAYGEDVDLGYRLQLAGEPTAAGPDAVVGHVGSASSGGARASSPSSTARATASGCCSRTRRPSCCRWSCRCTWRRWCDLPEEGQPPAHPADPEGGARRVRRGRKMFAKRRTITPARRIGQVAAAMTWNPRDLSAAAR